MHGLRVDEAPGILLFRGGLVAFGCPGGRLRHCGWFCIRGRSLAMGWRTATTQTAGQERKRQLEAFFFGSLDPGSFITIDSLRLPSGSRRYSARVFGFSSWSL
jgi:hypothetical protein